MVEPIRDPNVARSTLRETGAVERVVERKAPETQGGVAFQALLERLQAQASRLGRSADEIQRPDELAEAVEVAKTSLRDALALEEQLLEAYRQALRTGDDANAAGGER